MTKSQPVGGNELLSKHRPEETAMLISRAHVTFKDSIRNHQTVYNTRQSQE